MKWEKCLGPEAFSRPQKQHRLTFARGDRFAVNMQGDFAESAVIQENTYIRGELALAGNRDKELQFRGPGRKLKGKVAVLRTEAYLHASAGLDAHDANGLPRAIMDGKIDRLFFAGHAFARFQVGRWQFQLRTLGIAPPHPPRKRQEDQSAQRKDSTERQHKQPPPRYDPSALKIGSACLHNNVAIQHVQNENCKPCRDCQ
jgi:hypothetical protein